MSEVRIIKKYPNRRLYDTAISSYITLEDVRRLVLDNVPVKVIDARSQEEITHNTLLQIIVEQEEKGPHLFTTISLQDMIRLYGASTRPIAQELLQQSVSFFTKSQNQLSDAHQQDPSVAQQMLQNQILQWQQLQQQWLQQLGELAAEPAVTTSYNVEENIVTTT